MNHRGLFYLRTLYHTRTVPFVAQWAAKLRPPNGTAQQGVAWWASVHLDRRARKRANRRHDRKEGAARDARRLLYFNYTAACVGALGEPFAVAKRRYYAGPWASDPVRVERAIAAAKSAHIPPATRQPFRFDRYFAPLCAFVPPSGGPPAGSAGPPAG